MSKNTDVFVIGGGPAGLAAAIAARGRGFDVTIADGARPPIDKACGEGLLPDSLAALRDLGIHFNASTGFPFRGIRFSEADASVGADFPAGHGVGVRRVALHRLLLERARSVGVHFLWETPVVGIRKDGVLTQNGVTCARWIVGADGVGSRVRRWSGLDRPVDEAKRYASRKHYRVAPWSEHVEVHWGKGLQAYVTPVAQDCVCVVLLSRRPGVRLSSIGREFPVLAKRLEHAAGVGAERGAATVTRALGKVFRGNVALVGDASGSIDAIAGDGLHLSFRQALALAAAMEAEDLGAYEQAHRQLARWPRRMAHLLLLLDRYPRLRRRTMAALTAHPDLFARLVRVHVGGASSMQIASSGAALGWRIVMA